MVGRLDRRTFLKQGLAAAALLAAPARGATPAAGAAPAARAAPAVGEGLPRAASRQRVIVLGAGLAGLAAAWELREAGHEVTVLEARTRAGGRVKTLREPFADGLYAEAGAMSVYDVHDWTLRYLRLLAVPIDPIVPSELTAVYHLRGRRIETRPGTAVDGSLELSPEERPLGRNELWERYVGSLLEELGDPSASGWPPASLDEYEGINFSELLRRRGASDDAVALLRLGFPDLLGDGADEVSALAVLREALPRRRLKQMSSIRGGSDRFPQAFAERLAAHIRYGEQAVRIEHDARGVRVTCVRGGESETLAADRLVCALPFPVLTRIEVSPGFAADKRRAIAELPYTSVSRVFLQTAERFWLGEGLSGQVLTDGPLMSVWDRTPGAAAGRRGILESYRAGPQARRIAALGEEERIAVTRAEMAAVLPAVAAQAEGGTSKCWDLDPWTRGAYAWFRPGQMRELLPVVARAEGRVHFAGEHTSPWPGWMQGALESGYRAAREINESPA